MILGGAVSLLLLLGGPQAPPEDRPTSGGGYLAEYPIEIGDPWDMGGGWLFQLTNCKVVGPFYDQAAKKNYWQIEHYWGSSPTKRKCSGKYWSVEEANNAIQSLCKP